MKQVSQNNTIITYSRVSPADPFPAVSHIPGGSGFPSVSVPGPAMCWDEEGIESHIVCPLLK